MLDDRGISKQQLGNARSNTWQIGLRKTEKKSPKKKEQRNNNKKHKNDIVELLLIK